MPRAGCGFGAYGLEPVAAPILVLVRTETLAEAIGCRPTSALVMTHGRVVARDGVLLEA